MKPEEFDPAQFENAILSSGLVRENIRQKIAVKAGDTATLLGTTSDAAQLLLIRQSQIIVDYVEAKDGQGRKAAFEQYYKQSKALLDKIENGEVKMPFMAKGEDDVLAEIEERATAVAEVFE